MATVMQTESDLEVASRTTAKIGAVTGPALGARLEIDAAVLRALPVPGTRFTTAFEYGKSLWGRTCKLECELPTGESINYFLKLVPLGDTGRLMCEGEFESLKAMHAVLPIFATKPHAWGKLDQSAADDQDTYFLLAEFRNVGEQPPEPPSKFTERLSEMHQNSVSPTGKFGFHVTTCHTFVPQITDLWEEKWYDLYKKQYGWMVDLDLEKNGLWPEFKLLTDMTLNKVIPRLLEPLQSEGRNIKPCLIHGDLWDENAATDMNTGEPFVYDAGSFYGHNEYEIGNWRTPRHRLSKGTYVRMYLAKFPPSEPVEEWDSRNLLYSLRYELHAAVIFRSTELRHIVFDGMTKLCQQYFPEELCEAQNVLVKLNSPESLFEAAGPGKPSTSGSADTDDEEEEEEEEEERL